MKLEKTVVGKARGGVKGTIYQVVDFSRVIPDHGSIRSRMQSNTIVRGLVAVSCMVIFVAWLTAQGSGTATESSWTYSERDDPMGRGTKKYATVRSLNEFEFKFPYTGVQRATLWLRVNPKKFSHNPGDFNKEVILEIERGQFVMSEYEKVLVRFDEGKAIEFLITAMADDRGTAVFVADYTRFVTKLQNAKKCRIEALFYQEGTRIFEFDVSGLKWSTFAPEEGLHRGE